MSVIENLVNRNDWIRVRKIKGNFIIEIYNPIGDLIDMGVICDPQLKSQLDEYFEVAGGYGVDFIKEGIINYYTYIEQIFIPEQSECNREISQLEIIPIGINELMFLPKEKLVTCLINREADYIIFKLASRFKIFRIEQIAGVWVNYYYYIDENYIFLLRIWENCSFTSELFIYQL